MSKHLLNTLLFLEFTRLSLIALLGRCFPYAAHSASVIVTALVLIVSEASLGLIVLIKCARSKSPSLASIFLVR